MFKRVKKFMAWEEVWQDYQFLVYFFRCFSASEKVILAQVGCTLHLKMSKIAAINTLSCLKRGTQVGTITRKINFEIQNEKVFSTVC